MIRKKTIIMHFESERALFLSIYWLKWVPNVAQLFDEKGWHWSADYVLYWAFMEQTEIFCLDHTVYSKDKIKPFLYLAFLITDYGQYQMWHP